MRAAVLYGPGDLRVAEVADPTPGPGELKVQVAACGICGTDLHLYRGAGLRQPSHHSPFVIGHEFAGTVLEVGAGVETPAGTPVAVRPLVACGACPACAAGHPNVCVRLRFHGVSPDLPGGMAEFAVVRADMVHVLPTSITADHAALVEPLSVGLHAVRQGLAPLAGADPSGVTAAVFGAGPIGIAIFLCLRALGVGEISVVEPSEMRRAAIAQLGAATVIDPTAADVRDEIRRRTGGAGADVVFETAGKARAFTDAERVTARRGRLVIVATYEEPVSFDPFFTVSTERTITGALGYRRADFDDVIALFPDLRRGLDAWVTTIDLADIVAEGFEALGAQRAMKLLVRP
ncbi:MAG: alcohol dehydrogenase catalytic domain-containing protein [Microbacteriaceae bacterium]